MNQRRLKFSQTYKECTNGVHVEDNQEVWIIGCGDPHYGDDGISAYIVNLLKRQFIYKKGIYFRCLSHLTPGLINDLRNASSILFIETTVEKLKKGWRLKKVEPDLNFQWFMKYHATPGYLLGLLQSDFKQTPLTWMISVQGYDFSFEEDFYPETQKNMERAACFIYRFLESITHNYRDHINNRCLVI
jgi:Ni,Fe-hydrogenase maturation factor